jgi:hypothetical protein
MTGRMTGRMDEKDDPHWTKPRLLYKKINEHKPSYVEMHFVSLNAPHTSHHAIVL